MTMLAPHSSTTRSAPPTAHDEQVALYMRAHEWLQHCGATLDQARAIAQTCAPQHVARAAAIAHAVFVYQAEELPPGLARDMAYHAILGAIEDCRANELIRVRRVVENGYFEDVDFMKMIPPTSLESVLRAALLCLDTALMDHTSAVNYHLVTI